jgi:choline dehydrogenase-like flavoprotein
MTGALLQIDQVRGQRAVEDIADVVIIGSGAAGATAARVLTEAGADVVVIEEGPQVPTVELRSDMYSAFKRLWRDMGMQTARGRSLIPILQGACVGGTTAINGAIVHRLPGAIHRDWCRDPAVEQLFSETALQRAYDRLDRELSVDTVPEEVLGENSRLMRAATRSLGLTGNEIRRNVRGCRGSAHCNQGCPTAQRQSMNITYVPRAIAAGARVYATCRARRLLIERGRAAGVTGRFAAGRGRPPGPPLRVRARHAVVVAASAIQTPIFLRENEIGRASGLVGRRLQAHPATAVVGRFDRPVEMWSGATQGYESLHFWDERMKLETVAMPLELTAARLPDLGADLMGGLAAYRYLAIWGVEIRARTHGRVRPGLFSGASIEYDLSDEDVRTFKVAIKRLTEMLFAAGAREVFPGVHGLPDRVRSVDEMERIFALPSDPRLFQVIAAHLFGTARMGSDPRGSVVDAELQAHDLPGLYVFDSSVFPTNIGVNPQHTICAVSWLAAERLAERIAGNRGAGRQVGKSGVG